MHVPDLYRANSTWIRRIISSHPLALLVTNGPHAPYATHLPILIPPDEDNGEPRKVLGHMNRANPHWMSLAKDTKAKLIFTGPHHYVSPTAYPEGPAAPTWNFISVHLDGTLSPLPSGPETLEVVCQTAHDFETRFGNGWNMDSSLDYLRQIVTGVGAFRFHVEHVDAMFKLSQEKHPDVQRRVMYWLGSCGSGTAKDLADFMHRYRAGGDRE
ncbi:FMN-binding negative transcriptional regulator [Streptomyces noursei]|uniref:FMN-binding negative transcriptional regulator n=1 Tax=Streptomyces noursei TaxID=1971 RepID=UPI001671C146|nr:FMN-binding negative transcriptional regulator [Streptomyces noursei]MCZ1014094.1 FMN-binding negative transcriptional regulator [Streptomyces noursei]GGX50665.1 transcriptional regulator [Streptomyces noursei]